jgi:hypothetical protein
MPWGVLLVIVMVGTAVPTWRGDRRAAVFLVIESALWLYIDRSFEGPHLIRFGHQHSLVLADLVAVVALIVAALSMLRLHATARKDRTR